MNFEILHDNIDSIEILVHNLSHSDLALSVNSIDHRLNRDISIARPKFSQYREICHIILNHILNNKETIDSAVYPKYKRSSNHERTSDFIKEEGNEANVGFILTNNPLYLEDKTHLRFRRDDITYINNDQQNGCYIDAVYFPLMAILVPKWLSDISTRNNNNNYTNKKLVLILVSGRGNPPTDSKAKATDNSTKYLGQLINFFLSIHFPNITVLHIHSSTNLFRYDENVIFVKQDLVPVIDSYRNQLANKLKSKWKEAMSVTLSFADGASARVSSIQAALKYYRPTYFHFWQLKTFWSETIICEDDIECHSYDLIATDPAFSIKNIDKTVKLVIDEMEKFRKEFDNTSNSKENDLTSFWMRKTLKPVLAVLLVQKGNNTPKLYRGTNMEVSMPTGSLCAERNVIGTALADDITLKREDLRLIAVYSAPALSSNRSNSISDVYDDDKQTLSLSSPSFDSYISNPVTTPTSNGNKRKIMQLPYNLSPNGTGVVNRNEDITNSPNSTINENKILTSNTKRRTRSNSVLNKKTATRLIRQTPLRSNMIASRNDLSSSESQSSSICLDSSTLKTVDSVLDDFNDNKWNYEIVKVDENDMNPLKPCGACQEWLKKIAEVNPQFSVITFTDMNCSGVYIEPIVD